MEELTKVDILKRLDVIISLLLRGIQQDGRGLTLREQIRVLRDLGVRPVQIAAILGKTPSFVNKELSLGRKS